MSKIDLNRIKSVYCVGLGGVGVSAIAKHFLADGIRVSGSDPVPSPLIDDVVSRAATYYPEQDGSRLKDQIDLVVYSDACRPDNPDLLAARKRGVETLKFSQALGLIMSEYHERVAISGTNGKSTTTAIAALLWIAAGQDPTVFVGSRVSYFNGNYRRGHDENFIVEADEYRDHFHQLDPTSLTITNIEPDHLDYFKDLAAIKDSFRRLAEKIPAAGRLIICTDDPVSGSIYFKHPQLMTYGFSPSAQVRIIDYRSQPGVQKFTLQVGTERLGPFVLHLPGKHNVMNATSAITTALANGLKPDNFIPVIKNFRGIWRRFEVLNPTARVTIVNDYAHHPTAVRATLDGAREFYPGRRILAVFQPHHQNRLNQMFNDFTTALTVADHIIITAVYEVLGRQETTQHTSSELVQLLRSKGQKAEYAENPETAAASLRKIIKPGDVVIIMGAGDIWTIAQPLADEYGD